MAGEKATSIRSAVRTSSDERMLAASIRRSVSASTSSIMTPIMRRTASMRIMRASMSGQSLRTPSNTGPIRGTSARSSRVNRPACTPSSTS